MQFEKVKKFILDKLKNELAPSLTYHSLDHIKDVYAAAENLAGLEGVSGEDLTLLLTAVLFHDSGFIYGQKEHESVSCSIATEHLTAYGYTPEQIERVRGMIMATQIPQTPKDKIEQIICDSDLDYLGRDDFFKIGDTLYNELRTAGVLSNENDWNKLQVSFLEKHHYFTASAIKLRRDKKAANLAIVKTKIKDQ